MSRNVCFEGFIIKKNQMLDASYVVTLFTKSHGKISMIAKGAKKITSKRASHLQTGNKLKIDATRHISGGWYMGSTLLITGMVLIKNSPEKSAALYVALQLIDILIPENVEERQVYASFSQFLVNLCKVDIDTKSLIFEFASMLISQLGFGTKKIETIANLKSMIHEISGKVVDLQLG